jgi:hypothetical protein
VANQPAVALTFNPAGPQFAISEQCDMPVITATATIQNITPDPKIPLQFQWNVTLVFTGSSCVHSLGRVIKHPPITATTPTNTFQIPFTQVRGGDLTVGVSVRVGNATLTAQSSGLQVVGTNPALASLRSAAPANDAFRKLTRLESGLRQFLAPSCPLFSGDNKGGVGLCQLTSPPPTEDQVWSWKANLNGGLALWNSKEQTARGFPAQVRNGAAFKALVKAFNDQRAATAKAAGAGGAAPVPPQAITVTLPDYTADQLQRETLRGFNGWAGGLHEFRPRVDANGVLVVTIAPGATTGAAEWEEISAADRIAFYDQAGIGEKNRGDPNYVADVMGRASF